MLYVQKMILLYNLILLQQWGESNDQAYLLNLRYIEAIRRLKSGGEKLLRTVHMIFTPGLYTYM